MNRIVKWRWVYISLDMPLSLHLMHSVRLLLFLQSSTDPNDHNLCAFSLEKNWPKNASSPSFVIRIIRWCQCSLSLEVLSVQSRLFFTPTFTTYVSYFKQLVIMSLPLSLATCFRICIQHHLTLLFLHFTYTTHNCLPHVVKLVRNLLLRLYSNQALRS